jgi:hypothetical protein
MGRVKYGYVRIFTEDQNAAHAAHGGEAGRVQNSFHR